ncbi:MAG: response regulator transcription factor [Treponema sp.]|nr:response regulator transcription factor [Treponema sp.]
MIYLLEDDESIQKLIIYSLKTQNMECRGFIVPSLFWKEMKENHPDLILLDLMLPEEDGLSVLKKLRDNSATSGIPVIMLTARDTEFDMVSGLDAGADDYITKPFSMMNLISRIKAVLRRYEKKTLSQVMTAGSLKIDSGSHRVFADEKQIFLTVKEFDLLLILIKNRGKVFTREELLNSVWNIDADVESRTVDVHIRTLRQKLGKCGDMIETIRGVGYVINDAGSIDEK